MIFQSQKMPASAGVSSFSPPARNLQRKCACGGTPGPSGECAECKRKRLSLQPKLAINQPGDRYEQEADRVADAIVGGASSKRPAISSLGAGTVQREEPAKPKTEEEKYKEAAKKVGEAFLQTPPGKEIEKKAEELGDAFISTLPGKVITGVAVSGAIATLAATHKELPIGIPEIPLNKIKPGLKMKITYEGPVDKPSKVMVGFSFKFGGGKSGGKKSGPTESEKRQAETARRAAEDAKFREGLRSDEDKAADAKRLNDRLGSRMLRPDQLTPRTSPLSFGVAGEELGFHPGVPAAGPRSSLGPLVPDFKLSGETQAAEPKKEEEKTLQRKSAEHSGSDAPAIVDQVLQSSGQPLDSATRTFMERRFAYDFSNVRIHRDAQAADSARAVDAQAYTVGSQIVFNTSRYTPETEEGRRLLAHELTHVVQQGNGSSRSDPAAHVPPPASKQAGGPVLQRQPAAAKKKFVILSLSEIRGDDARKNRLEQTHQTEAKVCKSVNKLDAANCPARLKAGAEVTYVDEPVKGAWLQIENPGDLPMFGPKERAYILAVFAKEKPPEPPPKPPPASTGASAQEQVVPATPDKLNDRLNHLPTKARWKPPTGSPSHLTKFAIDLVTVGKDFYFNEPIDREAGDKCLHLVKTYFVDKHLTDSNFDKRFHDLSGTARTSTYMLLQMGRGSLNTLLGKIRAGQVIPGDAGSEATWQYHLTTFIAGHEVMEVLSGDLDIKEAKNIQAMEIGGGGKGFKAFADGLLTGAKSQLSDEDYKALGKKLGDAGVLSAFVPPVILAGATVGIAKDVWAALKTGYEALTDWSRSLLAEMIENIVTMMGTLMFDEEGARVLGQILGEEKGKEIKKLSGEDIFTFTYKLGEMIGPTVVYTILAITSAGAVGGALVSERLALFLKRFPKVAKGLERIRELMPKGRTLKAAEEAAKAEKETAKAAAKRSKTAVEAEAAAKAPTAKLDPVPTAGSRDVPSAAEPGPPQDKPPSTIKKPSAQPSDLPGATGTRHLPREFRMPTAKESSFPETSAQVGTPWQRERGRVRGRGKRVGKGEVGAQTTDVPRGRSGTREHWNEHGHEFPEYSSARQYEEGAIDFCRASTTRRFYYRHGGRPTIGYYDTATNTFAATSVDGRTIYTYFRPGDVLKYVSDIRLRGVPPGTTPRHSTPLRQE
jgi:Domain of unknown function (DUF4157)